MQEILDGLVHWTARHPRIRSDVIPVIGHQRLLEGRILLGGQDVPILLMTSLDEVDRELSRLLTVLGMAVPLALACCIGLGYVLARKALAPVEHLRRSTREITAERLDRRLPVANADDELGRLAGTINEMIARLERSFAEVRRFTADASPPSDSKPGTLACEIGRPAVAPASD